MPNSDEFGLLSPTYKPITQTDDSTLIKSGIGKFRGVMVTAISIGATMTIYDSTDGTNGSLMVNTFVPEPKYYPMADVEFKTGLFITVAGTVSYAAYYF